MSIVNKLIRKLPYPYLGCVSISNDIDYCSFEFFEEFMKFVNTKKNTRFGTGLGLELSSSFFGFSRPDRQFSYFGGIDWKSKKSCYSSRIDEYIVSGYIDANHAFGDFDGIGGFTRDHALKFYEFMNKLGADLRIFINHGDELNNQCIGPGSDHHLGDISTSDFYHTDLLDSDEPFFISTSNEAIGHVDETPPALQKKSWMSKLLKVNAGHLPFRNHSPSFEVVEQRLRDGKPVHPFSRLRGTGYNAPNLGTLNYQVSLLDFHHLYSKNETVVLYQHWGVISRVSRQCISACVDAVCNSPTILSGLYKLALESEQGKLWVPSLYRLLNYNHMVNRVKVEINGAGSKYFVSVDQQVLNPQRYFSGLTLYVDPKVTTSVYFGEVELAVVHNGLDHTGAYSVTVKSDRMEDIW